MVRGEDPPPKGKCPDCGKLVSKSNTAKHRKRCGKKKPPKTRKAINRDSYACNKDKILQARQDSRLYTQFRRLEVAREQLAELDAQPVEVEPAKEKAWTPCSDTNILYGVSLDPELFDYFLTKLKEKCKARHGRGPTVVEPDQMYKVTMLILHPDVIGALRRKVGERVVDMATYGGMTTRAFNVFNNGLNEDTDMTPRYRLVDDTDVAYSNECRRVRLARAAKKKAEATYSKLIARLGFYRKKVDRYLSAKERYQADFQARQEKANNKRAEKVVKLKATIAKLESFGPCASLEEFKDSYLKSKRAACTDAK